MTMTSINASFNVKPGWNVIETYPGEAPETWPTPLPNIIPGDNYKWYVYEPHFGGGNEPDPDDQDNVGLR